VPPAATRERADQSREQPAATDRQLHFLNLPYLTPENKHTRKIDNKESFSHHTCSDREARAKLDNITTWHANA
jgi:hypothetical protein